MVLVRGLWWILVSSRLTKQTLGLTAIIPLVLSACA